MMMSSTSLLFFIIGLGLCQCQYDDYDYPGGDPGSGDYGSGTTAAPATTKKPSVTTKAPTTTSGKTVVFPKLKSPIAGYKFTKVFGVAVFVHNSVSDAKLQHAASIMAEWLDNDEDGCVDTPVILKHLLRKDKPAFAVVRKNKSPDNWAVPFNNKNSTLATLTDAARGQIPRVPSVPKGGKFPATAYYTYDDKTCEFTCNAIEYWWWSTASITGLLNNRSSVKREFKYYLPEVFKAKDPKMYALITDTTKGYRLPTRPPNGKYTGKKTCASGANVI